MSEKLGISPDKSKGVVGLAIPLLMKGLAKNSSDPGGADSLLKAITQDHNGEILNNVPSAINNDSTAEDGGKILDHILGDNSVNASQAIGNHVNIDPNQVMQILSLVAPVVLGAVGKQQKKAGLDSSGLNDFLQNTASQNSNLTPKKSDLLSQILDKNNDGNILDDVANIGMNMLGGLFKKSK